MAEPTFQRANRAVRGTLDVAPPLLELSVDALAVLAVIPEWWRRRTAHVDLHGDHADVHQAVEATCPIDPSILGAVRPALDLADMAPEHLADAYIAALDPAVRNAHGRHYTPPRLADLLWQQSVSILGDVPDGLVLDPACGTGALLRPALRDWLSKQRNANPSLVLAATRSAIAGRDLDAAAVWLGSVLLAAELLPVWARVRQTHRRPLPALLSVNDGLAPVEPKAEVVLMNPPYRRVRLDDQDRAKWAHVLSGHANLYGLFLAAALDQVAEGGVISALVPAGWIGGAYSKRLRQTLHERAPLKHLTYVTERDNVFSSGVLQETVLASFTVGGQRNQPVKCERVNTNGTTTRISVGTGAVPPDPSLPWLLPREPSDVPLLMTAARMPWRLSDYGWRASTGPLVWNRAKDRISERPRRSSVRILWAADIDGGRVHRDRRRNSLRYIQPLTERERKVLILDRPAVLVQRTTAPEQNRRLLAALFSQQTLNEWGGQVVVENHVNVLTCQQPSSALTPRLLNALLAHPVLDRLYRCLTGSVAVSAYELAALPLPEADTLHHWTSLDDPSLAVAIAQTYGGGHLV